MGKPESKGQMKYAFSQMVNYIKIQYLLYMKRSNSVLVIFDEY